MSINVSTYAPWEWCAHAANPNAATPTANRPTLDIKRMLALLLWNSKQKFTVSAREVLDPGWLQGRRSVLALAGRPPASRAAAPGNSWSSRIDSEVPCHFHPANPAIAETAP